MLKDWWPIQSIPFSKIRPHGTPMILLLNIFPPLEFLVLSGAHHGKCPVLCKPKN